MHEGRFAEAAKAFDRLAQGAEERGMVARAGQLNLEAARCYLRLDDLDSAYERARRGLHFFREAGRPRRVREVASRILRALQERGRHKEAEELKREWEALIGSPPPGPRRGPIHVGEPGAISEPIIVREELPERALIARHPSRMRRSIGLAPIRRSVPTVGAR